MRWIPPGRFMMGSPEEEDGRGEDETQHPVTLTHGYWLGESSCTQALWQAVMGENPSRHEGDDLPVEQVSWNDCRSFIAKLGKQLPGLNLVLPTEAQWEYACRAGSKTAYWWGDEMDDDYANMGRRTEIEARYPANDFGLRSMSGNVLEWCADRFGDYPSEPVTDPIGPAEGHERVLRGGGWFNYGRFLRSACRSADTPDYRSFGLRPAGG
ncbi:MAG: formylglycine-generating enzyme family protein [Candidatus Thiodiazotropha sp. (ex Epidulcina cf. delphinae)]|nr:formylglycine-generating enzyme family protein [Candidatus Thiodiazotropha sp. (ex Epidulcina cf. delphinae)]